ncbi:MAG: 50S ribosomal protein L29 [Leptolyngbyaceae cyanobacterium SM1_1_3]|nr:50S ribosomal protein L29 [Leptolyngbyaceae cyanobacterium SM1_1_3]NJN03170.1 50S ribosomal protein L29 [Leptolyngbyaceae cyanobacterium RM1_1_2]NJO08908.1 50S ribosomal protein L29 [Leptolyngbyaceae cyanobacterium SL_1_1]
MPLPKIESARKLSDQDLIEQIVEVKQELFQLRFQKATRQLETEVHRFKHTNHRLAQLMTVQRQRQLAMGIQDSKSELPVSIESATGEE